MDTTNVSQIMASNRLNSKDNNLPWFPVIRNDHTQISWARVIGFLAILFLGLLAVLSYSGQYVKMDTIKCNQTAADCSHFMFR